MAAALLVAIDDGEPVGDAIATWGASSGSTCSVMVYVLPGHRRRGIGTALLREAIARVPERCLRVWSEARYVPTRPDTGRPGPGVAFPEQLGMRCSDVSQHYTHPWPQEAALLDRLDPTSPAPDGARRIGRYRVTVFVDGVPEVFQAGFGRLLGMVDAEAPTGDRIVEAAALSPEAHRAGVESWTSGGGHVVDAFALLDDGARPEVVAFNRVVVPGAPAEPAAPDLSTGETRGFPPSLTVGPSVSAGSRMAGELEPATAGARRHPRRATCLGGALVAAPLRR